MIHQLVPPALALRVLYKSHTQLCRPCTCCLQGLTSSITKLHLRDQRYFVDGERAVPHPSLPAQMQHLSDQLLHLNLDACTFYPMVLANFTNLQHLQLTNCALLAAPAPNADADAIEQAAAVAALQAANGVGQPEGTAALLQALQALTQLQHLQLELPAMDADTQLPESFAALTASSQLTHLCVRREGKQPLARGAMQHMFAAGRQYPHLKNVLVTMPLDQYELVQPAHWCLDSADLASMFSCCPAIEDLNIVGVVQPDTDLSVLRQLPESCWMLLVGGAGFTDAAASVLAQLTQLQDLGWCNSPGLTDVGLEQLTALTDLSRLWGKMCLGLSEELMDCIELNDIDLDADEEDDWMAEEWWYQVEASVRKVSWKACSFVCRSCMLFLLLHGMTAACCSALWFVQAARACSPLQLAYANPSAHAQQHGMQSAGTIKWIDLCCAAAYCGRHPGCLILGPSCVSLCGLRAGLCAGSDQGSLCTKPSLCCSAYCCRRKARRRDAWHAAAARLARVRASLACVRRELTLEATCFDFAAANGRCALQ